MKYDPQLAALLAQPWSNNACWAYVIYAMKNCGFSPTDIRCVVAELYEVLDFCELEEAHMEDPVPVKEKYTYQVGKIQFIVTPVYKDKGESMRDILLKLMLADLEPA